MTKVHSSRHIMNYHFLVQLTARILHSCFRESMPQILCTRNICNVSQIYLNYQAPRQANHMWAQPTSCCLMRSLRYMFMPQSVCHGVPAFVNSGPVSPRLFVLHEVTCYVTITYVPSACGGQHMSRRNSMPGRVFWTAACIGLLKGLHHVYCSSKVCYDCFRNSLVCSFRCPSLSGWVEGRKPYTGVRK